MSLVYSRHDSGLVVASAATHEAAVARALRELDDDLRLVKQYDDENRQQVWKVFLYRGSERPAEFITGWWDEMGRPIPELTMQLVEKVKRLRKDGRNTYEDPDVINQRVHERQQRETEQAEADLAADWATIEGRVGAVHRSPALAAARRRGRRRGVAF